MKRAALMLPDMRTYIRHMSTICRQQADLARAVVIVSDGTGVARAMPPYDLTRNGTSLDGEVLYVLDLDTDTPERLHAHFPDRDIYRYRRRRDQVNGMLKRAR